MTVATMNAKRAPASLSLPGTVLPPLGAAARHGSLALMLTLGVFCTMDAMIIGALLTPIKTALHLTDENFGRLAAAFTIPAMLAAPLFGALATRFRRKPVLIGAVVLWSLASAGGALAAGVATLMLWRAVTGFGEAAYQGIAPGWIADLYSRKSRNFVFSLFMLRNKLGAALALGLGGWLAARYDWRIAFIVTGLPGLGIALLLLLLREPAAGAADGVRDVRRRITLREQVRVLKIPPFVFHLVAVSFAFSGVMIAQQWMPAYLHRVYGLTNLAATGFLSRVLLFTAPCGLIGGYLVGHFLSRRNAGMAWAIGASSLLAAAMFVIAFSTRDLAEFKIFAVLAVLCYGSTAGTMTTLLVETVPVELRSVGGSLGAFVSAASAGMVAPWVLGALSDHYGLARAIYLGPAAFAAAGCIWAFSAAQGGYQSSRRAEEFAR